MHAGWQTPDFSIIFTCQECAVSEGVLLGHSCSSSETSWLAEIGICIAARLAMHHEVLMLTTMQADLVSDIDQAGSQACRVAASHWLCPFPTALMSCVLALTTTARSSW